MNTQRIIRLMIAFAILMLFASLPNVSLAQKTKYANGSGKIVTKRFESKDFDKLDFIDFNGKITVEIGKPFSVEVDIDDNLVEYLEVLAVEPKENVLTIRLKDNQDNRLWFEKNNIAVRVSMPEMSVFMHKGNSNVKINNIMGRYFRINHKGNGNIDVNGKIELFDIVKDGNGNINAQNLVAQKVNVKSSGNGEVIVNCPYEIIAKKSGNGEVINKGNNTGKSPKLSWEKDEDKLSETTSQVTKTISSTKRTILLKNNSAKKVELKVKYYPEGSYGITVKAYSTVSESLPIGSEIYKGRKTIVKVADDMENAVFEVE